MQCEIDTGAVRAISSGAELATAWAEVGADGHLILSEGERFLQAAKSGSRAVVQFGEAGTVHEASTTLTHADALAMLQSFLSGDESWRGRADWTAAGAAGRGGGAADRESQRAQDRDLGQAMTDEALRAAKGWAGRIIRQGIRRFFR